MDPKDALETPQLSLPPHDALQVTPSDTTITLPTPDAAHAQLADVQCHHPPRFIFYPISWDGSDDLPVQSKKTAPSDIFTDRLDDDYLLSPSAVFCSTDAFWSIDRWRRDVVKCAGGTADLLDPIQDADTPMPLLSLPHDHFGGGFGGTQPATDGHGSEHDSVQLWIHP